MKINAFQFIAAVIPALLLITLFSGYEQVQTRPDSGGYIAIAKTLVSGEIFEKIPLDKVRWDRAVRSPGYPALIVIGTLGDTANINNMLIVHLIIALFTTVFLSWVLRHYSPPLLTGLAVVFVEVMMRDYYIAVMTEFTGFNMLLVLFGMTVMALRNPTLRMLFFIGLLASMATLVRPALIVTMVLMPLLWLYRGKFKIADGLIALSALPVLLWMSFNLYTIEGFTLTQVRGLNYLGIGSQVGYAEEQPGDSDELKKFIKMMNELKKPPMGEEDEHINNLDESYKFILLNNSLWVPYENRAQLNGGPVIYDRELYEPYGRRAILANLGNYAKYVIFGLTLFYAIWFPYAVFVMALIPLIGIYRQKNLLLSYGTLVMFAIHVIEGVLVSGYEAVWDRYIVLTFYPYAAAVIICAVGLVYAEGWHERITRLMPESVSSSVGRFFKLET